MSLGLALAACGGKAVIDGAPGEGGTSSVDPLAGVACGDAGSCTFECCLDLASEDTAPYCATNCPVGIAAFSCDGPEDCSGGSCCGDIGATACKSVCEPNEQSRCHTDADCDGGTCQGASVAGVDVSVCGR